jgi:ATP-dependent DNA helicase PIF1
MERHNKKWDNDEIKKIFDELKNDNNNIENIALELKRTPNAVNEKLYQILNLLINIIGIDINIISNIIKISSENIIERLNKYNKNEINTIKINTNENNINENDTIKINTNDINTNNNNEIILNKKQEKAFNEVKSGKNVFITGPGGTGKSFVINKIIQYCKDNNKKYGVTSTTGSSALLIGGKTIHSYLGIGLANKDADELFKEIRYKYKNILTKIKELEILIIDEISMMSSVLFDKISCLLCLCRKSTKQFGGIQLILTGDFCQLESINNDYCFNSYSWNKLNLEVIFLNKMIRQNEDKEFKKILCDLRYGICTDEIYKILCKCKDTVFDNLIKPTILYSRNEDVDKINKIEYDNLIKKNAISFTYPVILPDIKKNHEKIKKWIKSLDIKESIDLCIGAHIIITVNINQNKGLINGTSGYIIDLLPSKVIIQNNNNIHAIEYYKCSYIEDPEIYFKYMPVKLAYAITIHKSQGMTLDAIEVDIGDKIFAYGQAYTALSRVRNLKNIKIKDISKTSFLIDKSVINFYKQYDKTLV